MARVALLPANQLNPFAGKPGVYEKDWAQKTCISTRKEFERHGHTVAVFYEEPRGDKSTDELGLMLDRAMAWGPDYVYSIHADWASGVADIFPQIRNEYDRKWGTAVGEDLASRVGLPFQKCAVRTDLMFFYHGAMEQEKALLMEIGRFNTTGDADFLMTYAAFLGIMAARAFLRGTGLMMIDDGPVPAGTAVPPRQERWLAPVVPKEMPTLSINWRQRWRFQRYTTDPFYTGDRYAAPIFYLEWKLRKLWPKRIWDSPRGVYDPTLEQDVRVFQKEKGLAVDGVMKKVDWAALMAPGAP